MMKTNELMVTTNNTTTTLAPVNAPVETVVKSTKKSVKVTKNTGKVNTSLQSFIDGINTVDNGKLVYGTKNNLRTELCKLGFMVNGKSTDYRPLDAYMRFNSGVQFQLLYSNKTNSFTGFNIRLTDDGMRDTVDENGEPVKKHFSEFDQRTKFAFLNTVFTSCNDGKRILKSDKVTDWSLFGRTLETLNGIN